MAEPVTTTAAGGYLISKAAATFAALLGALSVSFFYQPKKLHEHGKLAAGAIVGGISVSAAFTLAGIIANQLGVDFAQVDNALGIGYIIGITSVGVIAWVANFLSKREDKDILEIAKEIKDGTK
jgi:acyl-coenzyme A thioesterase PaaI-like protein